MAILVTGFEHTTFWRRALVLNLLSDTLHHYNPFFLNPCSGFSMTCRWLHPVAAIEQYSPITHSKRGHTHARLVAQDSGKDLCLLSVLSLFKEVKRKGGSLWSNNSIFSRVPPDPISSRSYSNQAHWGLGLVMKPAPPLKSLAAYAWLNISIHRLACFTLSSHIIVTCLQLCYIKSMRPVG